jgi:membrane protease YdiL (CAAX protease family)
MSGQWNLAVVGIVYSWITSAALWQNFRERLPYLFDPWFEKLPEAPTLTHAMVAISALTEGMALLTGVFVLLAGNAGLAFATAASYGMSSILIAVVMQLFLNGRAAPLSKGLFWRTGTDSLQRTSFSSLLGFSGAGGLVLGACGGLALGLAGRAYMALLLHFPEIAHVINESREQMSALPGAWWYSLMAVGFAPLAEEYLFRGLLFRALDREWGGWKAVLGSAAFFAIYHPTLAWLPVFSVGAANAILFRKSKSLFPAVVLHAVYNFTVLT